QGVAIETQKMRRPNLIAAGGAKSVYDQRSLDFAQHSIVEPGGWQIPLVGGEVVLDVAPYGRSEPFPAHRLDRVRRGQCVSELRLDDLDPDDLLRIQRRQPTGQVLQLANVARPTIAPQALHRR